MTTQETIAYLKACFDAEEGVADCARMIDRLKSHARYLEGRQYDQLTVGQRPVPTVYFDCEKEKEQLKAIIQTYKSYKPHIGRSLLLGDIGFAITQLTVQKNDRQHAQTLENRLAVYDSVEAPRHIAENAKLRNQYELALAEYQMKNAAYRENSRLADQQTLATLQKSLEDYTQTMDEYAGMRDELYAMDILYPDFRNPIAEDYLIRYLEMGICTELTGPNGAYRLYLDDIRTGKIVQAVQSLEARIDYIGSVLVHEIRASSNALCRQVQAMNTSLDELNNNLTTGLAHVNESFARSQAQFAAYASDTATAREKMMDEIRQGQEKLYDTISKSAYNQFIELRKVNLHNYLYYELKDPTA